MINKIYLFDMKYWQNLNLILIDKIQISMADDQTTYLNPYERIEQVPASYEQRNCTDLFCTFIGIIFSLAMILITIFGYNNAHYVQTNFPADTQGRLCGIDLPAYPYVYFVGAPEIERRVCVSSCPKQGDTKLECAPTEQIGCRFTETSGFVVSYFETEPTTTRNGMFCFPTDETLQSKLKENTNLAHRDNFMRSIDVILICMGLAAGASIIYMLLTQFFAKFMNYAAIIVGILAMIGLMVCLVLYDTTYVTSKWVCFAIFLVLVLITIFQVFFNTKAWQIHGILLEQASRMVCQRMYSLLYIPLFMIVSFLFAVMMIYEFKSIWTHGNLKFQPSRSLYYQMKGVTPIVLSILWAIQAVWGLTFIKEAFNFCIAGTAVGWYYDKDFSCFYPLQLLFGKHFGSVIGGSFMTGFFSIGDYIFDFIKPDEESNPDGIYTQCFTSVCSTCTRIFDLVRSDSMAYINLAGNPYCNSSRYCEYLCDQSLLTESSQSTSRSYRICAHFLIAAGIAITGLYLKGSGISLYTIGLIIFLGIFISTFFISIHADAAQAIQIIFLEDEEFQKRQQQTKAKRFDRSNLEEALKVVKHPELADKFRAVRRKQKEKQWEKARQEQEKAKQQAQQRKIRQQQNMVQNNQIPPQNNSQQR